MKIDTDDFKAKPGKKIDLKKWPTKTKPYYTSKADYKKQLSQQISDLSDQQELQYADDRYSLLIIFQAMDAAGKDGAIKHVMSGINPQGCQVFSFKHPSATELDHDFLWRTNQCLPERGRIGIFNRSYYEEVLITRVHPEILHAQRLPEDLLHNKDIWKRRYKSIADMEKHLDHSGTKIVKIFLHLSKDEQRERFLARIDNAHKNWKFSISDIEERQYWDQYQRAYEKCIAATSSKQSPWYLVPADDKENARLIISEILLNTLRALELKAPSVDSARKEELASIRARLVAGE